LARILKKHQLLLLEGKVQADAPLNFNKVAGYAREFPQQLASAEFEIAKDGVVFPKAAEKKDFH
jgi:hypothetical protein